MKVYILALFFVAAQANSQFEVKDAKNVTCVMLDLAGTLSLEATEVNKTKVNATIDFAKAALIGDSNCTLLKLNLEEGKAQVWFKLSNTSLVVPEVSFNSSLALKVGNDIVTVQADPLKEVPQNHSYVCNASVDHKFHPAEASNYTFSVVASLQNFHIQFGGIKNDTFGPSEDCDEDKTTTTASPNTTATTVTTAAPTTPTTTAAPNEDVFVCKEGNTTRLRFEANMSLAITYETTSNKSVTIHVSVPLHTSNDSACTNQTEEVLNIRFLDDWVLTYVFERSTNTSENYYVSKISLVYNTTYFKDAKNNETLTVEYTGGSSYLSASEKEYYRCNANSTVKLSSNVTLSTVELKYRAFNKDGDITLSGDATECSADEETSSVVPIAVGAALAGLVVIVLIAYLIGRRRSRKSGYESV